MNSNRIARCVAAVLAATVAGLTVATPALARAEPRPHPKRKPWPITITVQTVPVLPSIHLKLDGTVLTTDAQGRASYTRVPRTTGRSTSG